MSLVKNLLKIGGAALATFLIVALGAYLVLPKVAPNVVSGSRADSTTVAQAGPTDTAAPSKEEAADTSSAASAGEASQVADSTAAPSPEGRGIAESESIITALRDSVDELKQRVEKLKKDTTAIRKEAEALRGQVAEAKDQRVKAGELSKALLDMQRRELTALLKKVNMNVLRQLYQRASGRSRTRLLQSMPPKRAAQFVNEVVEGKVSEESPTEPVASQ